MKCWIFFHHFHISPPVWDRGGYQQQSSLSSSTTMLFTSDNLKRIRRGERERQAQMHLQQQQQRRSSTGQQQQQQPPPLVAPKPTSFSKQQFMLLKQRQLQQVGFVFLKNIFLIILGKTYVSTLFCFYSRVSPCPPRLSTPNLRQPLPRPPMLESLR